MKDVDTSLIKQVGKNAVCVVIIDKIAHDRTMFVAPHDIEMDTPEPETLKSVLNTKVLHLSSLVQPHGIYIQEKLTDVLRQEQILSFDPGELYAAKGIKALSGILRRTDILFVTEEEVEIMTHMAGNIGLETIYSMLNSNRTRYNTSVGLNLFKYTEGPAIVYKKGAKGAAIYSPKVYTEMSAEKVLKIVDNTGAGDAFNAGFLNVMFQGASAVECLKSGIRLAAFSLSFFGREWLNRLENKKGR
jgi:ribokinase